MPARGRSAQQVAQRRARLGEVRSERVVLDDGARTTVHVAAYDAERVEVRLALLRRPAPLVEWCAAQGVSDAVVGGFFTRPGGTPLGELRTGGVTRRSVPFDAPWGLARACVHLHAGRVAIAGRTLLPAAPRGDLLQAGPLLVAAGRRAFQPGEDPEGFSAGAHQFDSDITAGRHPRAALALAPGRVLAIACDGRARDEAGLTLGELADLLLVAGATSALNLDGGGSTSLVCGGELRNRPRAAVAEPLPRGRPVSTALVFAPR